MLLMGIGGLAFAVLMSSMSCSPKAGNVIIGYIGIVFFGLGSVFAVTVRYLSHVVSGIFAFSMYAGEGYSAVSWRFLYNTFALVDMAIALTVGIIILCNGAFRKVLNGVTALTIVKPNPGEDGSAE